jgi:Contractile injection system tube protein
MTSLVPATLQRLTRIGKPAANQPARVKPDGDALPVQFNPATLRLSRRNNVDRAGATVGTQKVQHMSTEPSTLTFELEFDTAEQGTASSRVDVRGWTALLRQFVDAPDDAPGEAPPAVQFAWGKMRYRGIVTDLTEELDYFAPDGTALHAKLNVTISEQRFELEATAGAAQRDAKGARAQAGASAGLSGGASFGASFGASASLGASLGASASFGASLGAGASVGMSGTADAQLLVSALDGESAQQLLARLDKDPASWRAAMAGLDSPLALSAGGTIALGAEVDAGVGGGVQAGFTAEGSAGSAGVLAGAIGVAGSAQAGADVSGDGFALAAVGGLAAASARVELHGANAAEAQARASFEVPGSAPSLTVDARATTYGRGVPLQATASLGGATGRRADVRADARVDARADAEQRTRDAGTSTLRWSPGR